MTSSKSRVFFTGCDSKTEWQLEWFVKNFKKHNQTPLVFVDFGVSREMRAKPFFSGFHQVVDAPKVSAGGWFHKPASMLKLGEMFDQVCWLDTDIHILGDMSGIFDHVEPNKLCMVEDKPWSARRGETWHNSGVVAFAGVPDILRLWEQKCQTNPKQGDQEVLHEMLRESPMKRMINISDAPNKYNWLRIQLLDGQDSWEKLAMHWTGEKGNLQIRKLMYNE
tara:strand:+ start:15585 stop:16250 length:666 start_codon:yes stop_codon:yes gene_type:complete